MTYQKHFKVVSFGDLVVDIVVGVSHFPIEHSAHQMTRFVTLEPGGSGNFLIAGAHLGLNMSALGTIGSDDFSTRMLDILNEKNIDTTTIVRQDDGTTTTVLVLADTSGRHVFLGNRGTGPELPLSETWRASLSAADAVQTWGYTLQEDRLTQAMLDGMTCARQHGCRVFFDPGPQSADARPEHRQSALENCDVVLLTADEIPHLLADAYKIEHARKLLDVGPSLICVKRGAGGCIIFTEKEIAEHPGFPVKVCDTSAAGDSFDAAFIYAYLQQWSLQQIAAFANAMGAAKVRKFGTGRQVPTSDEVRQVLEEFSVSVPF